MQKVLLYLFIAFTIQPAYAQYEEKDFVRYTAKNGLSDNYITCLQQDTHGYLWIGTNNGLNRFDGNSFTNFYQGSPTLSLRSGVIRDLKFFPPSGIGIIGRGGFQLLDTRDHSLRNYYIPDSTALSPRHNAAWDVVEMQEQIFGVTTETGFYVFNQPGKTIFQHQAYQVSDIGKKRILYGRNIFRVNDKEYLVYVEEKGLAYYNAEKKIFMDIDPEEKEWKAFSHPVASGDHWSIKHQINDHQFIFTFLKKDSILFYDHSLKKLTVSPLPFNSFSELTWESKIEMLNDSVFAINGGSYGFYLFHLNRKTGKISCDGKKLIASRKITSFFIDKNKRLWIGTNEGLLGQKMNLPLISAYHFPPLPGKMLTGGFTCTYRYKDKLYAGGYSMSKGLVVIDPFSMHIKKQLEFYGGNNEWNEIHSLEMYYPDTLWIGTNAGLLWLDTRTDKYGKVIDAKKYPDARPLSILASVRNDGYAWLCGMLNGVVARYDTHSRRFDFFTSATQPALPFDQVKNIAYDSYGDVWISGHSLARWNNQLRSFDTVITVYGGANKFNDDVLAISADTHGSLWLNIADNDLLQYRIKEKEFIPYSRKEGMPSDVFQSFSPVIGDILWIESSNSLIGLNTRSKKITVYDHNDGMPESRPTGRRMWYDREHKLMYMCSNKYLLRFPVLPPDVDDNSSDLILENIDINNEISFIHPADKISLKHNENTLNIHFTIIDFDKNNYRFAYKLNKETSWNDLGSQRNLSLNNLSPGTYVVRVKATGKTGNEKIKELTLLIHPPFWKTTWFLSACVAVLIIGFYFLYRGRIKQIRQKANIDKLLAQTEMKALHSQMNPHFIFNSLNSIREMILNNENKEASHYLSKFAQLIRMTLDQSGQSLISLRNTIDYLHRYIEMEKIRNGYFTWSMNIDKGLDLDETVLPPMLIQPFIENAIWHGVTSNRKNINIQINFKKEKNQLVCTIDDNGIGIEQSIKNKSKNDDLHNPFGITNVQNRIRLLNEKHNLSSAVAISDKRNIPGSVETGTLVALNLPLEINEE